MCVLLCKPDIHSKGALVWHHIVLRAGVNNCNLHLDIAEPFRLLREAVVTEPLNIRQRLIYGVHALIPGCVTALACADTVKHHKPLLRHSHLERRRLSHYCKVYLGE